MKLTTNNKDLLAAMQKLAGIVERTTTMPALGMVRMVADGNTLNLTATDLSITASVNVSCTTHVSGSVCAPADKLLAAAKAARYDVDIELTDGQLSITSGKRAYTLQTLPAGEFPAGDTDTCEPLPVAGMMTALRFVRHAMATNDVRYFLNGALIEVEDGQCAVVGTDGRRLAVQRIEVDSELFESVILPRKSVLLLPGLFDGMEPAIEIGENRAVFTADGLSVSSRLVDGNYPDWRRVVKDQTNKVDLDASDLLDSISAIAPAARKADVRTMKMHFAAKSIALGVSNEHNESAIDVIECEHSTPDLTIAVSLDFLSDAVSAIGADTIGLKYTDSGSQLRIDDNGRTCVVMPVRL